jgi:hypothetical protein
VPKIITHDPIKQNTVQTYYRYISAWCGWCVNEGYLEAHYAQRASAVAPLPEDDGPKPGDQQAWTSKQRHVLTRHVDERARYAALKATRDRALVFVFAYTAVRVGELLRNPTFDQRTLATLVQEELADRGERTGAIEYLAPHGGRRGMGEVLVRAFDYTVAARYLDNSEEMVRERYSHIEAGELGDVATEAVEEIDGRSDTTSTAGDSPDG